MNMKTLSALALLAFCGMAQYAVCNEAPAQTEETKSADETQKPAEVPQPSEETPAKPPE